MMVGTDDTMELWWPPFNNTLLIKYLVLTRKVLFENSFLKLRLPLLPLSCQNRDLNPGDHGY